MNEKRQPGIALAVVLLALEFAHLVPDFDHMLRAVVKAAHAIVILVMLEPCDAVGEPDSRLL